MKKGSKKKDSLHFSNSFPSSLPHTHLLSHLSLKKKILKEVKKKREKKILYTPSFSLIATHTNASHSYLSWKKYKNIIKGGQKKKKEKAKGTSFLVSFSFDLFIFF